MSTQKQRVANMVTKELVDQGLLIEGGFAGFRIMVIPEDAPEIQVREMRTAFLAGAQHLFSSIMNVMDSDAEPTQSDLNRMNMIASELDVFADQMTKKGS